MEREREISEMLLGPKQIELYTTFGAYQFWETLLCMLPKNWKSTMCASIRGSKCLTEGIHSAPRRRREWSGRNGDIILLILRKWSGQNRLQHNIKIITLIWTNGNKYKLPAVQRWWIKHNRRAVPFGELEWFVHILHLYRFQPEK